MKKTLFIVVSLVVFAVFNHAIYTKERLKANSETVLLELAPLDPRSLMQGDYMRLRYAIERDIPRDKISWRTKRGFLVIAPDSNHVGRFVRFHTNEALGPGEKLLRFHTKHGSIRIVPDSFMFEEGEARLYQRAKYGVFRFDANGNHLLTGLASDTFQPLAPQ